MSVVALLAGPALAAAGRQEPPESVRLPASALGEAGRALLDAVNGGERARMEAFVSVRVSKTALEEIPLAERVEFLARLAEQSGGFDVREAAGSDPLEVVVQSRRGSHWARIYAFADRFEAGKLREYGIVPLRDPALAAAEVWPAERIAPAEVAAEIGRRLKSAAGRDEFSGVVLVARGDEVIFQQACGLADKSWKTPITLETKFNLASMNKMFTAVAIAQLVEDGRLRFEDRLADVLERYPDRAAAQKITIEHLLTHTAGLGMLFDRPGFDKRRRYRSHAELLPLFASQPLLFEPGRDSAYSNEGFVVLGAVIEQVTGKSYYAQVRERIFAPAGMSATDSYALDDVVPDLAVGYARFEDDPLGIEPRRPNWMFLHHRGNACGGGYSTAGDLWRFVLALRAGRLVHPDLTATLLAPHGIGNWYGYGFQVQQRAGKTLLGHGGGGPSSGINCELGWFADGSWTAIVLGNYDWGASGFYEPLMGFLARQ